MADLVVIRIHPVTPSDPADFAASLAGLTISIFDRSYGNPTTGTQIGTASFDTPDLNTGVIVQHYLPVFPFDAFSVATAVIVIDPPAGYTEYQTSDLLLKITRSGIPIADSSINYNVDQRPGFALPLPPAPVAGDPLPTIAAKSAGYEALAPVALYWAMPTFDTDPSKAYLQVPTDGTPPNFDALRLAVEKVLAADPTGTVDLTKLSVEQCTNIAYEIVWNRVLLPLPAPSGHSLEEMYTKPGSDDDHVTQDRQQFESDIAKYYTTNDGQSDVLTKYVYAMSAALACQVQSVNAAQAGFSFPVLLTGSPGPGQLAEAKVALSGAPLGFNVPAPFFYALAAPMPTEINVDLRYSMATVTDEKQIFTTLTKAYNSGVISNSSQVVSTNAPMTPPTGPAISFEQAARRLHALGAASGVTPVCAPGVGATLVGHWLAYAANDTGDPDGDLAGFWSGTPTPLTAGDLAAHRDLVICAIAKIARPDAAPDDVVTAIQTAGFPIASTNDLKALTTDDWTTIFTANPNLLVDVTGAGSVPQRVVRWVRLLTRFFDVTGSTSASPSVTLDLPPQLDQSINDCIVAFLGFFTPGFSFGVPSLDPNDPTFQSAVAQVFPNDALAQAWLTQMLLAIDTLYFVTDVVGSDDATHFSLTEALYARGFTDLDSITALTPSDFADALIGTIAYVYAAAIQAKAGGSTASPPPPPGSFQPINPGTLTNCLPPPERSPFGPVAYLATLLRVTTGEKCDASLPGADPNSPDVTLGSLVAPRRGPLGDLDVTRANLETALPVVDLVNECLEAMVATGTASGVVYDTSPSATEKLLAAVPEHSSPATPVAEPHAYEILAKDFSSCCLPYNQPLDVNRSYLHALHSTRYAAMRQFRKEISEFVLDPAGEPATFPSYRWRYPVRLPIAREYLHVSPAEHDHLYTHDLSPADVQELYGFPPSQSNWLTIVLTVSEFLKRTCLSYCEFLDLWRSGFVVFGRGIANERNEGEGSTDFPDCPPCYLDQEHIVFPPGVNPVVALGQLAVFIRLWRTLHGVPNAKYSFATLRDICIVLQLFDAGGHINPDFIRQLAAFQMLRDDFQLELADPAGPSAGTGAERTHLLALWVGPAAAKWSWAVERLIHHVEHHAHRHHQAHRRGAEFLKLLAENLDALSKLAGFDPSTSTWWQLPTHTLRFAEVLAKIYASRFGVGELILILTADPHLDGDDPFPLGDAEEALDVPLELPDEDEGPTLWKLRHHLLEIAVSDEEAEAWSWQRIDSTLRLEFGYVPPGAVDPLTSLGEHFFPHILEQHGHAVPAAKRQYRVTLTTTTAAMWNTPDSPFQYDKDLIAEIPIRDEVVLNKLMRIRPLTHDERNAVRDLYYLPRLNLAPFAFLFENFAEAAQRLIEEGDEDERWRFFRRQFALAYKRCRAIAHYLTKHIDRVTGTHDEHGHVAWMILRSLLADENRAKTPWEDDSGQRPQVTWGPTPNGSAFAALLGLTGTGLLGEYEVGSGPNPIWREMRGPMAAFGAVNNEWNVPVPAIIPALDVTLTPDQLRYEGVRNGIAAANNNAARLGGAQSFCVTWSGVLLVDHAGNYRFWGGGPTPHHEKPDLEHVHNRRWRVSLRRGQRSWILLSHHWEGEHSSAASATVPLKRGAYDLTIEFVQCPPTEDDLEDGRPQRTGFQLKYEGPDTHDELEVVPHRRLFTAKKDNPLDHGIDERTGGVATQFLQTLYVSTLRDIRRTYQRAFKALLFARRFELSAKVFHDYAQSELGYYLDHPDNFAGVSFYGAGWTQHLADFDFNFLPLLDNYHPPDPAADDRVAPSPRRMQALFDIWERVFDYVMLRRKARRSPERPAWLLFDEAAEKQPDDPAQLLRHLDINLAHASLVLKFYRGYDVVAADLMDERWAIRVWRADGGLDRAIAAFLFKDLSVARPDLWASDDPSVVEAGETESGNQNLTGVVRAGLIENGPPERYEDVKKIDDGLRERARCALIAYLCHMDRVLLPDGTYATRAKHLTDLLLLDVEAGLCERASRIDEAITAVQTFVQRARLGLEPSFSPSPAFDFFWDRRFQTFRVWQACIRRTFYRENWIEWDELEAARKTESFRFLESELRRVDLTMPVPGGLEYWDGPRPLDHPGLTLLQSREPSTLKLITPPRPPAYDEALNLLGTPSRAARRAGLKPISIDQGGGGDDDGNPTGRGNVNRIAANDRIDAVSRPPGRRPPNSPQTKLPYWIEAAIRLGVRFVRVAAACVPPAAMPFAPAATGKGCCRHCGGMHDPLVDEFYFWILDSRWLDKLEGNTPNDPDAQDADVPGWHDAATLPTLLYMKSKPMVHLYWARIHNGEIEAPRRSSEGVRIKDGVTPDQVQLVFAGRTLDSLRFLVQNGDKPPGYDYSGSLAAGFRYDLATDDAIVLPEVVAPPSPPPSPWGGLPAYPFFAFFTPGAPLFPLTSFSESTSVASVLRAHCKFEAALRWYALTWDPLTSNDDWCPSAKQPPPRDNNPPATNVPPGDTTVGRVEVAKKVTSKKAHKASSKKAAHAADVHPAETPTAVALPSSDGPPAEISVPPRKDVCCRDTAVPDEIARRRDITLDYLETLVEWGDCLMLRNNPEAFQQARLIFDTAARILGPTPRIVQEEDDIQPPLKVSNFVPAHAAINPRLISLYERVDDRLALIHSCNNAHRLRNGRLGRDMNYFGDDQAIDGWKTVKDVCDDDCECCCPTTPYRFVFMIEKARELAAQTRELGATLLSAFEKGDAEYLAYVRAQQEKQIFDLQLQMKQNTLRDSDWQVQALQKTKEIAQTNLAYYQGLISAGLISGETDYQSLTNGAVGSRTAGTVLDSIAEVMNFIPDIHVGTVDFVDLPIGTKLSRVFETGARISNEVAEILSTTAGLRLTQAGWDRRLQEWQHQVDVLTIEIEQIERQILGAERRRDVALRDLNNHQQQIESSREIVELLRDKFTNHQLYLFLQKETAALYYQMYELALCCARQAQRAFNYERGHTARRFVPGDAWDNFREGLLAGERLALATRQMEKAYYDENVREYELTKHISLALSFGKQFLELKRTGKCEIELPEWLFDLDYPGQYMRRIKNVSLTIPCVTGPYTGVHCRLTLLSSMTRIDPRLHGPVTPCCEEPPAPPQPRPRCDCFPMPHALPEPKHKDLSRNGYVPLPDDPRIVKEYAAKEAIATSTGQNDRGLFELNFRDERYLPFEFAGAVSRWRLELPQENNFFDMDTLSDVVMQLNYTAREGGDPLRRAANEIAQQHIPDDGLHLFDLQRDFANEWQRLQARASEHDHDHKHTHFDLQLERRHFPFLPGHRQIWIKRLELFFEAEGAEPSTHHEVEFAVKHKHGCKWSERDEHEFQCVGSVKWPELFHGAVDVPLGPLHGRHKLEGVFRFEDCVPRIRRAWLLCHYETR
jgi:hypothetical protein